MFKGFTNGCVERYMNTMKKHRETFRQIFSRKMEEGSLTEEGLEKLRGIARKVQDKPNLKLYDLAFMMNYLNLSKYNVEHLSALLYELTGTISLAGVKSSFVHHPFRYSLLKDIASLLQYLNVLELQDRLNLFVGRKTPISEWINFTIIETNDSRVIFRKGYFEFKVDLNGSNYSKKESRSWVEGNREGSPVEMVYLERGVIVTLTQLEEVVN